MLPVLNKISEPFVDWVARVLGNEFPADHCYGLPAACFHIVPEVRKHGEIGILSIPGIPDRKGKILLTSKSHIRIRVPISKIPIVYPLAGKKLNVGGNQIKIAIPSINLLQPSPILKARIVTIKSKDCMQLDGFLAAAKCQLEAKGIAGKVSVPLNRNGEPSRKTIRIRGKTIIGYTTEVSELSDEDSIKLQSWGIGGRRHLGAGIFLPCN